MNIILNVILRRTVDNRDRTHTLMFGQRMGSRSSADITHQLHILVWGSSGVATRFKSLPFLSQICDPPILQSGLTDVSAFEQRASTPPGSGRRERRCLLVRTRRRRRL